MEYFAARAHDEASAIEPSRVIHDHDKHLILGGSTRGDHLIVGVVGRVVKG